MAIIQNWKFRSRSHSCSKTGKAFEEGDYFFTCIAEDPESDGFERKDYSEKAWAEVKPTLTANTFSYWRSRYEPPHHEAQEAPAVAQEDAETLLRRMVEEDDPRMDKVRYILVLSLERKKLLKQVSERVSNERRLLIYEHRKTGEVIMVTDPDIHLDEVEAVQDEVASLLEEMTAPEPSEGDTESSEAGNEDLEEEKQDKAE